MFACKRSSNRSFSRSCHEGPGSLLSELKRRGWCNSLYAGGRREARGFQFFNITLDLSEEGGEKCDEIVTLVYQYLNMLRREKPAEWIYDELNNLGKISFNFKVRSLKTCLN